MGIDFCKSDLDGVGEPDKFPNLIVSALCILDINLMKAYAFLRPISKSIWGHV